MMNTGPRDAHLLSRTILALLCCPWIGVGDVGDGGDGGDGGPASINFNRDIRPILSDHCFACHGPDANTRKADLRLDLKEAAFGSRDGQPAIVPGDSHSSELHRRVTAADPDDRMPPAKFGKPLNERQIELLTRWIDSGASWQGHWAFIKPNRPPLPAVSRPGWVRNELDYFILSKLEEIGLDPAPEASRAALIRRVTLDLTGLPPSPDELDAFMSDPGSDAYETVVDRLLESPRYGEQMTRTWLDLARYADSNGYQYDTERSMWRWRDWVIDAFNRNMPYDRFTIEQLAGDLLPNATVEQRLATGFNRNHPITIEGGIIDEEYRTEYVIDRVTTTSTVWLGLTMGCARCHDHKYDPISSADFYRFFAFFNQVPERGAGGFTPNLKTPTPAQVAELKGLDGRIDAAQRDFDLAVASLDTVRSEWEQQFAAADVRWSVVAPVSAVSEGGAAMTVLDDGSVLVGGENPARDVYEIVGRTDATDVVAVRLEAMTHESLPHSGPGRFDNANFVLSEFELEIGSEIRPEQTETIRFRAAHADHSQKNYGIELAIDRQVRGNEGWAVDGPTRRETRTAVFLPEKPFGFEGGTSLRFRLRHESGHPGHAIGRPRLALSSDRSAGVPDSILAAVRTPEPERTADQRDSLREYFVAHEGTPDVRRLNERLERLRDERKALEESYPVTMVMRDMESPRDTFMLIRGQYDLHGEKVTPGVPAWLSGDPDYEAKDRLDLARWLVDPENPLTARVAVNRFWQHCFGTGLVKTADDFGLQGEWPSHPELLDWLATEFVESGWDVKRILRRMVTSATYRQDSKVSRVHLEKDPQNRWLARGPRIRLPAEVIRDNALAVSGLLQEQVGGPSVYPYQPPGLWTELNNRAGFSREYEPSRGDGLFRRSLYTYWKRTVPPPTMQLFDAPEREFCVVQRSRTTTPLQALALLHDPQFVEAARRFAERIMTEGGPDLSSRVAYGFRLATARVPSPPETAVLREVYEAQWSEFKRDPEAALTSLRVGESARDESLDPVEHAAWTCVARVLLNLDESINKP